MGGFLCVGIDERVMMVVITDVARNEREMTNLIISSRQRLKFSLGSGQPETKFRFGVRENGPWNRKRPGSTRPVCNIVPTVWDASQTFSPVNKMFKKRRKRCFVCLYTWQRQIVTSINELQELNHTPTSHTEDILSPPHFSKERYKCFWCSRTLTSMVERTGSRMEPPTVCT